MSRRFCSIGKFMISSKKTKTDKLDDELLSRILSGLGINSLPSPDLDGLQTIYSAWCRKIPFDNIRKRIHLESGNPNLLPGDDPVDFFIGWLRFGTGGTCWAGSGALYSLLYSLGFKVCRGVATMLIAPDLPPNHGTVIVNIDGKLYLVDTSMLHSSPVCVNDHQPHQMKNSPWSIDVEVRNTKWYIRWRPLHMLDGCICRIEKMGVSHRTFVTLNEETRIWGAFNYSLYARLNRGDSVVGIAYGHEVSIDMVGNIDRHQMSTAEQRRFLVEDLGIDKTIVKRLPTDKPTPPPPGSKSSEQLEDEPR